MEKQIDIPYISSNLVLIKPDGHFDKIGKLVVNDFFDPAKHFSIKGKVLQVPNKLCYHKEDMQKILGSGKISSSQARMAQKLNEYSLEFDNDMEVEVGDEVIFRYINHIGCIEDGLFIDIDEKMKALFISYDCLFMAIKPSGDRVMLNGFIFVEPIEYTKDELTIGESMVKQIVDKRKIGVGVVREVGKPNRSYLHDDSTDDVNVKVGDIVYFRKTAGVTTELNFHKILNEGDYPYYRLQRKDILYIGS